MELSDLVFTKKLTLFIVVNELTKFYAMLCDLNNINKRNFYDAVLSNFSNKLL